MYNRLANKITFILISKGIIEENKHDIYAYGFEILVAYLFYILYFSLISIITCTAFTSLSFLLGFVVLRNFAGGYHAATYKMCHILFALNHVIYIFVQYYIPTDMYIPVFVTIVLISVLSIWLLAPVDHENRPFSDSEFVRFRKRSRAYTFAIIFATVVILLIPKLYDLGFGYLFGTLSATISLIIAKMKKYFNNLKLSE